MLDDEKYFELIKKEIFKRLGFNANDYEIKYLKRRINSRMLGNGVKTYKEYLEILKHCNEEYEKLLKSLTINVTEFFRNPEVFKAFEKKVIPELASRKGYIRIWSVGCATGEEPYSIAMLFQKNKIKNFKIYATDIDKNSLEEAMKGEYTKLPNNDMKQFFTCMNGSYKVKDEIKYRVKFARHDVLSDKPYKNMDVIFCRNMVIYLKTEAKKKLYMDFYDLLNKSGYLVLGKTELLLGEARDRFQVVDNVERIYQKYN